MTMLSDVDDAMTQARFAELIGVSPPTVSGLVARGVLSTDGSASDWLLQYCANLREQAAGRQAGGGLNLATERARLARMQADLAEAKLLELRGLLVPVAGLEQRLRTAVIAAREFLRQQPPRLAREVFGKSVHEIEDTLSTAFDVFLHRIAAMNSSDPGDGTP